MSKVGSQKRAFTAIPKYESTITSACSSWLTFGLLHILNCSLRPDKTQYHTPPEMSTQALGIYDDAKILDFDGHAEVVVPNIDVLKKLVEDNFFSAFAKPDEEALVDIDSVMRTIGYEEIHVENGRAV